MLTINGFFLETCHLRWLVRHVSPSGMIVLGVAILTISAAHSSAAPPKKFYPNRVVFNSFRPVKTTGTNRQDYEILLKFVDKGGPASRVRIGEVLHGYKFAAFRFLNANGTHCVLEPGDASEVDLIDVATNEKITLRYLYMFDITSLRAKEYMATLQKR